MTQQKQLVAIERQVKNNTSTTVTKLHQELQKESLFNGMTRVYQPKNDEGDRLPDESTRVQLRVKDQIEQATKAWGELFDLTLSKDTGNCSAKANLEVGGKVLAADVPVTTLLFLEDKLTDLHTFVKKLPQLNAADEWKFDANQMLYRSEPIRSQKTKRTRKTLVKAEATDKHPAQVDVFEEDVIIGDWITTKLSSSLPASEIQTMLSRVEELQKAVKFAIESANSLQVDKLKMGTKIFDFVFG